jgi:hypothetical protein
LKEDILDLYAEENYDERNLQARYVNPPVAFIQVQNSY